MRVRIPEYECRADGVVYFRIATDNGREETEVWQRSRDSCIYSPTESRLDLTDADHGHSEYRNYS